MADPLDRLSAWLDTLTLAEQATVLAAVLDRRNAPTLTARRAAAVYALTRAPAATYDTVAVELGVSRHAVLDAVKAHNRLTGATNRTRVPPTTLETP